jgi:effector-binding domain-containing protein
MIDTPHIVQTQAQASATIHLTVPRDQIQSVMGPAMQEVMQTVAAQGAQPAGPLFSYHRHIPTDTFDFEVGVPVARPVDPAGRVQPSELPATRIARTIYRGPYEGLGDAWCEFMDWMKSQQLKPAADLWECYLAGPESSDNPADWRTELNRPLL